VSIAEKRETTMVGSECISNHPILNVSGGVGYVTDIAGVNTYVTGSRLAILAIVFISDIYGMLFFLPNISPNIITGFCFLFCCFFLSKMCILI